MISNGALQVTNHRFSTTGPILDCPADVYFIGIPKPLVLTLVEVYFDNVYNASLLLHKRLFLESLAANVARPHVVLGVCAWAAKYATAASRTRRER